MLLNSKGMRFQTMVTVELKQIANPCKDFIEDLRFSLSLY